MNRLPIPGGVLSVLLAAALATGGMAQAGSPAKASPSAQEMPSYANSRSIEGRGILKICSKPVSCYVRINGQQLRKDSAVLTVDNLKPGVYDIVFETKGGHLVKRARVAPGQTTVVFASLESVNPNDRNWKDPLKKQAEEQGASYEMQDPAASNVVQKTWNKVTGKKGSIQSAGKTRQEENAADLVDAEITFELAQLLQNQLNPFNAQTRYERALELYKHIIEDFPRTPYVELAHYYSGRIYESMHYKEYGKAMTEYQIVLKMNPTTSTDSAARLAKMYGSDSATEAQLASIRDLDSIPDAEMDEGVNTGIGKAGPLTASNISVAGKKGVTPGSKAR